MAAQEIPQKWHEETDVAIIGSGFAGLAAAIEARKAGASVIILEKMKGRGGNSLISDGCVAAAGSPLQKKDGIEDSPERLYKDMLKAGLGLNHPDLARMVAEKSEAALHWTIDVLGVRYKERVIQFGGHSVPRTCVTYNQSGSAVVSPLLSKLKELRVEVRTRAFLEKLLRDREGSVKGIRIREGYVFPDAESGTPKCIRARRAVILATGGFASDVAFRAIQDPRLTRDVDSTNRVGATAEALVEAMRIGAAPVQLSWIQLGPWTSPDEKMHGVATLFSDYVAFPYGMIVNPANGRRFMNELADRRVCADAMLNVGRPCIGIADAEAVMQSGQKIEKCLKKGVVKRFNELEEFAEAYSIPFEALRETVDRYNGYVLSGQDEEFGKPILKGSKPLVRPPYHGIRLWPKVHYTMGGIRINTQAQVVDLNHEPIRRLYAAGEVTGGVHGACRLGSLSITECLVFGRIAGKNAAAEKSRG